MTAHFCVHGAPVGKARPRLTSSGRAYTPQKTRDYEALVKWEYRSQTRAHRFPDGTPLTVLIDARFPIPKSTPRKKALAMIGAPHLKKPDADNVAKAILDALNGLAYADDSAICDVRIIKSYDIEPCAMVTLTEKE